MPLLPKTVPSLSRLTFQLLLASAVIGMSGPATPGLAQAPQSREEEEKKKQQQQRRQPSQAPGERQGVPPGAPPGRQSSPQPERPSALPPPVQRGAPTPQQVSPQPPGRGQEPPPRPLARPSPQDIPSQRDRGPDLTPRRGLPPGEPPRQVQPQEPRPVPGKRFEPQGPAQKSIERADPGQGGASPPSGRFLPPKAKAPETPPGITKAPGLTDRPPGATPQPGNPNVGRAIERAPDAPRRGVPGQAVQPAPDAFKRTAPQPDGKGGPTGPGIRTVNPPVGGPGSSRTGLPAAGTAPAPDGRTGPAPALTSPVPGVASPSRIVQPPPGPQKLDQVRAARVRTEGPSGQTVIREPGNRTIVRQDNRVFITRNETSRIQAFAPNAQTQRRRDGVTESVFVRPDGTRVYSEVDGNGRLLRRYRRDTSGRDIVFVDNRRFYRNLAIGAGAALAIGTAVVLLSPPAIAIPREKYIVDYESASDDDIYEALTAPPIERLERTYSLDEIRYSESVRARVRRVDLDTINFEFGSFEVSPDQYPQLERIARGIGRAIENNAAEVFLIEGHTDAVGSDEDNISLSDRRAEAVARILVEHFNIPMENLVTQGYGEQHLKIETQGPERANRRVAVRRITPLLSQQEDGPRQ